MFVSFVLTSISGITTSETVRPPTSQIFPLTLDAEWRYLSRGASGKFSKVKSFGLNANPLAVIDEQTNNVGVSWEFPCGSSQPPMR